MPRRVDTIGRLRKEVTKNPPKTRHRSIAWRKIVISALIVFVLAGGISIADEVRAVTALSRLFWSGKYLVLFQNNTELRPTGGFIGSFATVTTANGRIRDITVEGNVYDADLEFLKEHHIPSPKPFERFWPNSYVAMSSSNWSPDFSTSAEQVKWFYEREYNDSVDGVVAINASAVADFLKINGTISISDPQLTFTSDNFLGTIQRYIEEDYYETFKNQNENKPKSVLGPLSRTLLEQLTERYPLEFFKAIQRMLANYDVQFFFPSQRKQALVERNGWSAEIVPWAGPYLAVNNANLNGGKGSFHVDQSIVYNQVKNNEVVVTVIRANRGREDYPVPPNFNYMRLYVPEGSTLQYIHRQGIDVADEVDASTELGKAVFGLWVDTPVGESRTVTASFRLSKLTGSRLLYHLQSGSRSDHISVISGSVKVFEGELREDRIFGIL